MQRFILLTLFLCTYFKVYTNIMRQILYFKSKYTHGLIISLSITHILYNYIF